MAAQKTKKKIRSRYSWDAYVRLEPRNRNWAFTKYSRITLAISALILIISFLSLIGRGLNLGIDFKGGIIVEVQSNTEISLAELRQDVAELQPSSLSVFGSENEFLLRFELNEGDEISQNEQLKNIRSFLTNKEGQKLTIRRAELVGPTVGSELVTQAIWAVATALLGIMVYIWFRFEWNFGVAGLLALMHDVFIVLGCYALFQIPFSLQTVAAVLAMAGYSINDSVVVFDRMRENIKKFTRMPLKEIVDRTLNEVISRSFMTSFTTFLAIFALFLFGGPVLRDFVWALMIGIVVGTWSSLVIATPILLWFPPKRESTDN